MEKSGYSVSFFRVFVIVFGKTCPAPCCQPKGGTAGPGSQVVDDAMVCLVYDGRV